MYLYRNSHKNCSHFLVHKNTKATKKKYTRKPQNRIKPITTRNQKRQIDKSYKEKKYKQKKIKLIKRALQQNHFQI